MKDKSKSPTTSANKTKTDLSDNTRNHLATFTSDEQLIKVERNGVKPLQIENANKKKNKDLAYKVQLQS